MIPTTRPDLFARLIDVVYELNEIGRSQFDAESTLRIERDLAMEDASERGVASVQALNLHADHETVSMRNTVADLRSQRLALEEERDLIKFLLDHGYEP